MNTCAVCGNPFIPRRADDYGLLAIVCDDCYADLYSPDEPLRRERATWRPAWWYERIAADLERVGGVDSAEKRCILE